METSAEHVRLQFDGFVLDFRKAGWSLYREGQDVLYCGSWEEVWSAMTTAERVRCIAFASQLR
jgi:hypothetical protein